MNNCINCGCLHDEVGDMCYRCAADTARYDEWEWVAEEPPPHKDDF